VGWHPASRTVSFLGRPTHVVDVGEGPAVLLLHGFLHSSYTWREACTALAREHRVIAPCLPGFGWSGRELGDGSFATYASWLSALLDRLGAPRLGLAVGNSLGGGVLLELALAQPARFGELLLVSPLAAPLRVPALPFRVLGHRAFRPLFRWTAGNRAFVRHALRLRAYRARPVDDELLRGFEPLGRPGSHAAACAVASAVAGATARLAGRLGGLEVPAHVLWGGRDGVLPLGFGRRVAALLPRATFEVWEGSGHCPHEEEPGRFQGLVTERLSRCAPGGYVASRGDAPAESGSGSNAQGRAQPAGVVSSGRGERGPKAQK